MKAIYAGSFDPFTNGHLDIVKQASKLFDTIEIVIANNESKVRKYNLTHMADAIFKTLLENSIENCLMNKTNLLIADYAKNRDITFLIRGLRNPNDYQYEENIAKINKEINPDLNTIYFRADNEVISSSMVRELFKYGKDVSKYVSPYVLEIMKRG